jgi:hypothetical protein
VIAPRNESYPTQENTIWVLYYLRDPEAFEQARKDRKTWGREYAAMYLMGLDHMLIVFRAAGTKRIVPQMPSGPRKRTW